MSKLSKIIDFKGKFDTWWLAGARTIVNDNRKRYRMILADKDDREARGLSAIPSTKSCSIVDNFAIDATMEYFAEPDNITFTAKDYLNQDKDLLARWLTQIFKYRATYTFPFQSWLMQALKIVAVDGMLGALVSWKKESYKEKVKKYGVVNDMGNVTEIPEQVYREGVNFAPERFIETEVENEVITKDTWWINTLKPGENIFWDFKNESFNINDGTCCLVIVNLTKDDINGYVEKGIFKKISDDDLERYSIAESNINTDRTAVAPDPDSVDLDEYNRIPLWIWFEKKNAQWFCSFSINGEVEVKTETNVNDVFFGNRKVNKLPIVLGCVDFELWENLGRGLPKIISPLEDELINHKNNINDAAKLTIQGRWRINPGSDIDVDALLNKRVFEAMPGEYDRVQDNFGVLESFRAADSLNSDISELVPVGMSSKYMVPKGTDKTLGAVQLAFGEEKKSLNSRLMIFNTTFMNPLLYLIAQNIFSFETDETVLRIAGYNVKTGQIDPNTGRPAPFIPPVDGNKIDLSALDFEFDIQINAGLGSIPRHQKFLKMIQIFQLGTQLQVSQDKIAMYEQACVLAGFNPDQFKAKAPDPPPPPDLSGTVNIDISKLRPDIQEKLIMTLLNTGKIKANFKDFPDKTSDIPLSEKTIAGKDMTNMMINGMDNAQAEGMNSYGVQ